MTKLDRYRLIPDRVTGANYMHRYYLFLRNRSTFPFNVTLHKIVKSEFLRVAISKILPRGGPGKVPVVLSDVVQKTIIGLN